ncbi:MAG: hypothetical protein ACOYNI_02045 [Acidimicrobiia bacterium]
MSIRKHIVVGVAMVATVALVGCGGGAKQAAKTTTSAATSSTEVPSSTTGSKAALAAFCTQSEKIAPLLLLAGLAGGLGSAAAGSDQQAADTAAGAVPLLFSQQYVEYFKSVVAAAPPALAADAKKLEAVYSTGPERLKKAGFTDAEIKALAQLDPATSAKSDPSKTGAAVNQDVLESEAAAFAKELAAAQKEGSADTEKQFDVLTSKCADLATGGVQPCDLLTADAITSALGVEAKASGSEQALGGGAGCSWSAGDSDTSKRRVALTVAGASRYETLQSTYEQGGTKPTSLSGVGDGAFIVPGYSSPTGGSTGGRTIIVKSGTRTFVIGVQRDRDGVEDATLTALAEDALKNLK